MSVQVITIHNVSPQIVKVLYNTIGKLSSNSTIPYDNTGDLAIVPHSSVQIEIDRIDLAQIQTMRTKGLITTTISGS